MPTTSANRTRGSNLCRLRSGAPVPSRKIRPQEASGEIGAVAKTIAVTPSSRIASQRRAKGSCGRVSPHKPRNATSRVPATKTGSPTSS